MEKEFLNNGDITITNTRIIVGSKVYLLKNISSFDTKNTYHLELDIDSQNTIQKIIYIIGAIVGTLLGIYFGNNLLEDAQASEFLGKVGKWLGGWFGGFVAAMIAATFFAFNVEPQKSYTLYHILIDTNSGTGVDMYSTRSYKFHKEILQAINSAIIDEG